MLLINTGDKPRMGNGVYLAPGVETDVPKNLAQWALQEWPDSVVEAKSIAPPKNKMALKKKDK